MMMQPENPTTAILSSENAIEGFALVLLVVRAIRSDDPDSRKRFPARWLKAGGHEP